MMYLDRKDCVALYWVHRARRSVYDISSLEL